MSAGFNQISVKTVNTYTKLTGLECVTNCRPCGIEDMMGIVHDVKLEFLRDVQRTTGTTVVYTMRVCVGGGVCGLVVGLYVLKASSF